MAARFTGGRQLRVLDVGAARGSQALRLARAGHKVTGVESDSALLSAARSALAAEPEDIRRRVRLLEEDGRETGAHFLPGTFDVVLCHDALMHVAEPDPLLAGLARVLATGGLLSILIRNADARAMGPAAAGDWTAALAALGPPEAAEAPETPELQGGAGPRGRPLRADRPATLRTTLSGIGAPLHAWYGVGLFTEVTGKAVPPVAGAEFERIMAAEERAGRADPYRAVAPLLHLCGVRD
ncbi:class I SAM-dependent methyltransferase [Streptomyces meridianus]|uniref:Class I SAM-dependent methyltransferase n=1 Tax=Streptomyces meridianus TaxID=2938945 RepID=A0ABT0X1F4_9ACTN|nr:class I SAM-dependent methyltransferase [Streptomyces meridianus]